MRMILLYLAAIASLLILDSGRASAFDWRGSVGLGVEFAHGSFGTASTGDILTAPLTIALYPTNRLDFSLEIPYVYQSGGNLTSSVNQSIAGQQIHARSGGNPGAGGMAAGGGSRQGLGFTAPQNQRGITSHGIGDLTLKAGYLLVNEGEAMPALRGTLLVKFPTADRDKALGTGAFDEGGTLELSKWLGNWYCFGGVGYTVQGRVTGLGLENYLTGSASVGYQLSETFLPLFIVKSTTPATENTGGTCLLKLKSIWVLNGTTSLEGYVAKGVTPSSPDFGAGLAVYRLF